ncbi:MAG: T9SS type A sorting domain-containing protein [Salibacter sp.]|uniref:T9SS type A sorting domain-containing protein n=1 Tax=Salibacter sp. TaxID=2010995 RepID=UPI002870533E|nr:T9SS type A sorting domain-containing protein [Salibacter sp.]MDR9399401.1 T9SS type A sorting domain-containing protein [Salibacter sp.]
MKNLVLTIIGAFASAGLFAQDSLLPLKQQPRGHFQESSAQSFSVRATNTRVVYQFDTIELPFIDDFSKNLTKDYRIDLDDPSLIKEFCPDFTVDGNVVNTAQFMTDTSYDYSFNSNSGQWDSTANAPQIIAFFDSLNCVDTVALDTVWPLPNGRLVNGALNPNVVADSFLVSINDTTVFVPPSNNVLWTSNDVYINESYGEAPPTIGVATFDGLDSLGMPHSPNQGPGVEGLADVFTSAPIQLGNRPSGGTYNNSDSIILSFYYQPQGFGDMPEEDDSLTLEFLNLTTGQWDYVWSAQGEPNKPFEQVFIKISNTDYYQDGFRFRFKNRATTSGNFDHWHIDYVRLDANRTSDENTIDDVAFSEQAPSILKDYSHVPWSHFKSDPPSYMADTSGTESHNMSDIQKNVTFSVQIEENGTNIFTTPVFPIPNFQPETFQQRDVPLQNFVFPDTNTNKRHTFKVANVLNTTPDLNRNNDTAFYWQDFGTYYSYDDGSAEYAYKVVGASSKMSVEYDLGPVTDSLRAINIYFPRTLEDYSDNLFRLQIYKDLDQSPVYQSAYFNPEYSSRNIVTRYELSEPLEVTGTIYVGIEQQNRDVLVGFDQNFEKRDRCFYNAGSGWYNISFDGSLMIHPEFDSLYNPYPVGTPEVSKEKTIKLYPNPVSHELSIEGLDKQHSASILDLTGREVWNGRVFNRIDVSQIPRGTYILHIQNEQKPIIKKFIKAE